MRRVLCLIESIGSGGAERQLTGLAVMLNQQGYEVEVWYYVKNEFYLHYLQENGVESCYFAEAENPKKRFSVLRKHIKAFKPDTVISYSASTSMITCLLKLLGAKFNLIVSERSTTQIIDRRENVKFFLYRWADHIVPNSYSQQAFIERYYPNLVNRIEAITNFVDTERFSPSASLALSSEVVNILCVGRIGPEKNILSFIEAITKVRNNGYKVVVNWFGQDLKDTYSLECYKKIQNNNLTDTFIFHPPSPIIEEEYKKAEVFCLPSLYEGFPNVLCEAMSCGLPVLCSRVCDNPNIVSDGINGYLFNPLSVDDMATIINRYICLPQNTKIEMGQKSREIAVDMFSKKTFIEKYISVIS